MSYRKVLLSPSAIPSPTSSRCRSLPERMVREGCQGATEGIQEVTSTVVLKTERTTKGNGTVRKQTYPHITKKKPPNPIRKRRLHVKNRRLPTLPHCIAVPSALTGLASLFGMGRGGTPTQRPPEKGGHIVHRQDPSSTNPLKKGTGRTNQTRKGSGN